MEKGKYIETAMRNISTSSTNKNKNICLVGLGPHAKRIYMNYFKKHKINLSFVVELKSQKQATRVYLDQNGFKSTKIFIIEDQLKDEEYLPIKETEKLFAVCQTFEITHMIISTEPKAHNMYLTFALMHDINVLSDKPITVMKNMTSLSGIKKVNRQYYQLLELSKTSNSNCAIMCQRQFHKGYEYIKKLLNDIVKKYQIPITQIDISHCDGNWELPHDMEKENHPYKYGYGKLFHSGYHFIDLLSDLLKINNQLEENKQITKGKVYGTCFTPKDELAVCSLDDIKRIFKKESLPDYYKETLKPKFEKYGEKNFNAILTFKNNNNQTITTSSLNLSHYGFSRRGSIKTKDFYKQNGRIRHEYVNIQVGTLMNIKVLSFQSKEIKDRKDMGTEELSGGIEHFDIEIFRNIDIIGGKPYEKIKLGDLYSEREKKNILGYNELSRERLLTDFLNNKKNKSNLENHVLGIEILTSCAKQIHNYYKKIEKVEKINFNKIKKQFNFSMLENKNKEFILNKRQEKKVNNSFLIERGKYEFGIVMNYLVSKNIYEIYIYITDHSTIVSGLEYRQCTNLIIGYFYFYILKLILKSKNNNQIFKYLIKRK